MEETLGKRCYSLTPQRKKESKLERYTCMGVEKASILGGTNVARLDIMKDGAHIRVVKWREDTRSEQHMLSHRGVRHMPQQPRQWEGQSISQAASAENALIDPQQEFKDAPHFSCRTPMGG